MDERHAIELCIKHRDPVGFEFLVAKHRREAFVHAMALLGNQEDALDACQDAFARAFAAIPGLKELSDFYPWFYRILRNRCLNLLDRRKTSDRYRAAQTRQPDPLLTEPATPQEILAQQEERDRIQTALAALKPELREILIMKYEQDYRYNEIAAILDIARGTVMSRLYHARMALREIYERHDHSKEKPSATEIIP